MAAVAGGAGAEAAVVGGGFGVAGGANSIEVIVSNTVNTDDKIRRTITARGLDMGHDYKHILYQETNDTTLRRALEEVGFPNATSIPSSPELLHKALRELRDDPDIIPHIGGLEDSIDKKYLLASDIANGGNFTNINKIIEAYEIKYFMIDAMMGNAFKEGLNIPAGVNILSVPTQLDAGSKMDSTSINMARNGMTITDMNIDGGNTYTAINLYSGVKHTMSIKNAGYDSIKINYKEKDIVTARVKTGTSFSLNRICESLDLSYPRKAKKVIGIDLLPHAAKDKVTPFHIASIKTGGDWWQLYRLIDWQLTNNLPILLITNDMFFLDICTLFLTTKFKPSFVLVTGVTHKLYCFDEEKMKPDRIYPSIWKKIEESFHGVDNHIDMLDLLDQTAEDKITLLQSKCPITSYIGYFIHRDLDKQLYKIKKYIDDFKKEFIGIGTNKLIAKPADNGKLQSYKELAIKTLQDHINSMIIECIDIIDKYKKVPNVIAKYVRDNGISESVSAEITANEIFTFLENTFTDLTDTQKGILFYFMETRDDIYKRAQVTFLSSIERPDILSGFNNTHNKINPRKESARSVAPISYSSVVISKFNFSEFIKGGAAGSAIVGGGAAGGAIVGGGAAGGAIVGGGGAGAIPVTFTVTGLSAYAKILLLPTVGQQASELYSSLLSTPTPPDSNRTITGCRNVLDGDCIEVLGLSDIKDGRIMYNLLEKLVELTSSPFVASEWAYIFQGKTPPSPVGGHKRPRSNMSGVGPVGGAGASAKSQGGGGYADTTIADDSSSYIKLYEMTEGDKNYTNFIELLTRYISYKKNPLKIADINDYLVENIIPTFERSNKSVHDFYIFFHEIASNLREHAFDSGIYYEYLAELENLDSLESLIKNEEYITNHDFLLQIAYYMFNSRYISYIFLNSVSNVLLQRVLSSFLEIEKAMATMEQMEPIINKITGRASISSSRMLKNVTPSVVTEPVSPRPSILQSTLPTMTLGLAGGYRRKTGKRMIRKRLTGKRKSCYRTTRRQRKSLLRRTRKCKRQSRHKSDCPYLE
jgi:hypothetical protein